MVPYNAPAMRNFNEVSRDPYLYGQFNHFVPSDTQTVYPAVEQSTVVNQWPYVINKQTGGEESRVGTIMNSSQWIEQSRWSE